MVVRHVGVLALIAAGVLVLVSDLRPSAADGAGAIGGPYAYLLASSADLGPSHRADTQLTAVLHGSSRPDALFGWAHANALTVRWRPGEKWAIVEGAAEKVAGAFGVDVHDYRGQRGQVFYASPQQPSIPEPLRVEVAELGRILGYTPHYMSRPDFLPLDVPDKGLTPSALLNTYNANRLAADGYTGKGTTIVFFAFDGFDKADLDTFASTYGLPQFIPMVVGGQAGEPRGETTMDLEVAHAIAPDARKVVINARPTVEGDGTFEKIGQMFESADAQFPGAVWSFSIGWGCDKLLTAADLAPVRSALATALSHGTTAFNASGDLAGLECKGGDDWSSPPGASDIGLDSVASLPEMVDMGGTTLSTDGNGYGFPSRRGSTCRCPRYRRWRVLVVRPPRMAARGAARSGPHAPVDPRRLSGRRPIHRRADHLRASRWLAVAPRSGPDLGRACGGDESVLGVQRRAGTGRPQPAVVPHRGGGAVAGVP